jgi:hypothetical protein
MEQGEERVAEAVAYAEILVPMLAERLTGFSPASPPLAGNRPQRTPRMIAPSESLGIADFIDEMLAQDRAGIR